MTAFLCYNIGMKQLFSLLKKQILSIEEAPTSYALWLTSFGSLILARIMVENWLAGFENQSLSFLFFEFTHTFFFFLLSFLTLWPIIAFFGKTTLTKASNVLLFGFLIILTPPILDVWIANGAHLWSFYKFDSLAGLWHRYLTLFGDRPDIGITYGVRIEVVLTTIGAGLYTFIKTGRMLRSLGASLSVYSILFILGTFPSWLTFIILGPQQGLLSVRDVDIAQLFLSPPTIFMQPTVDFVSSLNVKMSLLYAPINLLLIAGLLWKYFPKKFFALIHNARIPQIIYHGGLFLTGMGLALLFAGATVPLDLFNLVALADLLIAVGFAWLSSVVTNDLFDQNIDELTNPSRPLQKHVFSQSEYKAVGITFFLLSLLLSAMASFKVMLLLLAYQSLAWIYSGQPLRLKRFPVVATFFAAIACVIIMIAGFTLIAPDHSAAKLPLSFIAFFLFAFTVSLPFKDLKDIAGDKKDGVFTVPVIFGERWGKLIIGSGLFITHIVSVIVFHEPRFFFPALLCGSLSFWLVIASRPNEEYLLSYRKIPRYMIGIVAIYVTACIAILFR